MTSPRQFFSFLFRNFWKVSFFLVFLSIALGMLLCCNVFKSLFLSTNTQIRSGDALVLTLDIEGVIMDSNKFVKTLRTHIQKKNIKAVIIRVNSPGGAVGPSQAIYRELVTLREKFKKPIIMSLDAVAASGAYYISVGADKIVTNPGTLLGSIGVIINFANLENLYKWAKIERYSLKTGKFKDTGTDHRVMTFEERRYLQALLDEILDQFKRAIVEGRQIDSSLVDENADGRIFTGETAVKLGFADQIGNFSDAIELAKEMTGEEHLEIFNPKQAPAFWQWVQGLESLWSDFKVYSIFTSYPPTPMYLMPSL